MILKYKYVVEVVWGDTSGLNVYFYISNFDNLLKTAKYYFSSKNLSLFKVSDCEDNWTRIFNSLEEVEKFKIFI